VRDPRWRAQFVGKRAGAPLSLDDDIQNISGATLSCRHVTEGVKRILALQAAKGAKP
jgi:Na+-transporting NADH:ubiquinone oxidoreductase subunit NqrC